MNSEGAGTRADFFSDEERDILQEIMNIAFGNATADLADLIDIQVILSVPDVQVLNFNSLPDYLTETINHGARNSVTGQKFWGDFNGSGLLFLPRGTERVLSKFLNISCRETDPSMTAVEAENIKRGLLLEISNILSGDFFANLVSFHQLGHDFFCLKIAYQVIGDLRRGLVEVQNS